MTWVDVVIIGSLVVAAGALIACCVPQPGTRPVPARRATPLSDFCWLGGQRGRWASLEAPIAGDPEWDWLTLVVESPGSPAYDAAAARAAAAERAQLDEEWADVSARWSA